MKRIVAVLLAGCMFLFAGCTCSGIIRYADADKYTPGGFTYEAEKITAVDVDWSAGGITLKNGSGTLSVSESGGDSLKEEDRLYWWIDGTTLRIRFCKSGHLSTVKASDKHLTLELPDFVDLDVDIASGKIEAEGMLNLGELNVDTASGGMELQNLFAKQASIDSASGGLHITNASVTGAFEVDSASGALTVEQISADSVKIDSASGGIVLGIGTVNSVKIDSASGGITIRLQSAERGAQVRIESVSGSVNVKLPNEKDGNTYRIGSGECKIEIDSVSGGVTVE
ncbi:MAG: DUF4097 family beta strand repeat protein [Clostridia bacterium]|nr:DUF4097 family beta strand repeat protein [Clostridia bacterium]